MALSIGKVFGLLELTDNFTAKIEAAAAKLGDFGARAEKVGQKVSQVGDSMTGAVTVPIVLALGGAAKAAIDFESSFAGVKKTIDGTDEEFKALASGIRQMAKEMPLSVNEINKVAEAAGALGVAKQDVLTFTETMVKLGATTNLSADDAATAMARFANIMGTPTNQVEKLGAALVDLGNKGASTEREIVEMGLRIAGAGNTVGLTEGQVLGLANALSSVGIEAEMGGSAISKTMMNIAVSVNEGGDRLNDFAKVAGLSSEQFAKAWRDDAGKAFATFLSGLGKVKERGGDLLSTLAELDVTEVRMRDTLLRVAGAGDMVAKSMDNGTEAFRRGNALQDEYKKRLETTQSKLTLFQNKIYDVAITLGDRLLPALTQMVDALMPVLNFIEKCIVAFSKLPQPVQTSVFALLAFVAALGPLMSWGGRLITMFGQITALVGGKAGLTAAFGAMTGVLSALVVPAALAALAAAVWQVVGAVKGFYAAIQEGRGMEFLTQRDTDNFVRRWLGLSTTVETETPKIVKRMGDVNLAVDKFSTHGVPQMLAGFTSTGTAASGMAKSATVFGDALKGAEDAIRKLSPTVRADLVQAINSGAFSMDQLREKSGLSDTALQLFTERVKKSSSANEEAADKATKHAEKIAALANQLSGSDAIERAADMVEALSLARERGILLENMTIEKQQEIARTLQEAIDVQNIAGNDIPLSWQRIAASVKAATQQIADAKTALSGLVDFAKNLPRGLAAAFEDPTWATRSTLDSRNLSGIVGQIDTSKLPGGGAGNMAGGTKSASLISQLFGTPEQIGAALSSSIMQAIQGGGSVIGAAAGSIGTMLTSGLAKHLTGGLTPMLTGVLGGAVNAILPGLGALLGPLTEKLFSAVGNLFDRNKGRDLVVEFAESMGGFDGPNGLHAKLSALGAAGEALWIKLTQGTGRNNKDQARANIEEVQAALEAFAKKQQETTAATTAGMAAQSKAQDEIVAKIKGGIDALDREYQSLYESVKNEAPEEAMGIMERNARDRMAVLQDERVKMEEEMKSALETISQTEVDPVRIPYYYDLEGERPEGIPGPKIAPSDTMDGLSNSPTAGRRSQTINVNLDGKRITRTVVQHMPEELELNAV